MVKCLRSMALKQEEKVREAVSTEALSSCFCSEHNPLWLLHISDLQKAFNQESICKQFLEKNEVLSFLTVQRESLLVQCVRVCVNLIF